MGIGIDYGGGTVNCDFDTGIRYGVVSMHSVLQAWADSAEPDYGEAEEAHCPHCQHVQYGVWQWGEDTQCPQCEKEYEVELPDFSEPLGETYIGDGYIMETCLDTDIMVIRSPYFTFCVFCSPCVPGAGDLNTPHAEGIKTYCLGHDWFDSGKAPYPVYSVETGEEVQV